VDRSGAYWCRYIAENIVAAGLAERCEARLAFAIAMREPLCFSVDTFGTGTRDDERIEEAAREVFPSSLKHTLEELDLRRPIYSKTAVNGHFGREEPEFTWERTDKAEVLRRAAGM
jgi:S-adenosylmethionine synthetase